MVSPGGWVKGIPVKTSSLVTDTHTHREIGGKNRKKKKKRRKLMKMFGRASFHSLSHKRGKGLILFIG